MVRRCMEKAKSVIQWGKIILPLSSIRYYPPQFILRNPVLEGVNETLKAGYEAVVIVFAIKNMNMLAEQLGSFQHSLFMKNLKKYLRMAIELEIAERDVITLHDFYGDSLSLFIKVDYDRHCFSDIDLLMKRIAYHVESKLELQYHGMVVLLETGYMFIEKDYYSLPEAVAKAHRQAVDMAEKKVMPEINEMVFTIKRIVEKKDIHMLAQPIMDVATKEIRAWEMLTRGPKDTVLENPLPLFSVARQTGMLYELEMLVLEKALQQIKLSKCRKDFFINFTPITLGNIKFTRDLKRIIEQYKNISPSQIIFEVTERDSIDEMKDFNYNIKILRLMGFRIAVDDTGAGYSSLNTISEIMPDIIKIDRTVIENIHTNSLKESILKGLLLVAREAGSLVVAEGIETAEEASVLSRNNVDLAQGYFYARPTVLIQAIAT